MEEEAARAEESGRLERTVDVLKALLERIRGIPRILTAVLCGSVASGLLIAWIWFVSSDHVWIRWLAAPWLALAAVPQLGLWFLTSSMRELFELPGRLLALKSGITEQGARALERIRREETELESHGFLRTLKDGYRLHGEVGKVVATRTILHRFTGPIALLIGPVSFVANCVIIAVAILTLVIRTPGLP
jgi:hypothetical protein